MRSDFIHSVRVIRTMSSENRHRDATSGNNEGSGNSGDSRFGTQQGHIECPSNDEAPTVAREGDQQQATTIVYNQYTAA